MLQPTNYETDYSCNWLSVVPDTANSYGAQW